MAAVIIQKWEESERGWGTRPDGYSAHKSEADRVAYIEEYWKRMPEKVNNRAPDEYSRPCGAPYIAKVSEAFLNKITGLGLRSYDNEYPGGDGIDGWIRKR